MKIAIRNKTDRRKFKFGDMATGTIFCQLDTNLESLHEQDLYMKIFVSVDYYGCKDFCKDNNAGYSIRLYNNNLVSVACGDQFFVLDYEPLVIKKD